MDLGTIIGLVLGQLLIVGSILLGGSLMTFINPPSIIIVVGGVISAILTAFPLPQVVNLINVLKNTVNDNTRPVEDTTAQLQQLAQKVRKEDLLSLENEHIADPFMARAVRLAVDGVPVDTIRATLSDELTTLKGRHSGAQDILKFTGTMGPAFGMIGTLIGLVQMLQALDDPSSIGPAMAVALLTTLYGAIIANCFAIPLAEKLAQRTITETQNMRLIIEGIDSIVKGENVMITKEKLEAFLSPLERAGGKKAEEAPAA